MKEKMNKNRGVILIFVLGISLALASLILFFNYETKKYIDYFTSSYEEIKMERVEEVGFEIARKILENDTNNYDWTGENWNKERTFIIDDYELKITITDENSKININRVIGEKGQVNQSLLDLLKNLFEISGYSTSLVDCLLDWIDEDNLPRASGAENFYYSSIGLKNIPPNRNLLTLKELFLIKGFDEKIIQGDEEKMGILSFVTIYSDDKININTCRGEIINAMGFTGSQVDTIIMERENRPLNERFLLRINRNAFLKNRSLIKYKSNYFHVSINIKDIKGNEKLVEGVFKKDKNVELIKKGIL